MLVHSHSHKQCKEVYIPLVLCKEACYAHILFHVAVVACHYIVQPVLLELDAAGEYRGREEALVNLPGVCGTGNPCEVVGLAVCIGVALCAVVAVAVNVLCACKE